MFSPHRFQQIDEWLLIVFTHNSSYCCSTS